MMQSQMGMGEQSLLDFLGQPENSELSRSFSERVYMKNSMVYTPVDPSNYVFVVKKGRVRVFLTDEGREFNLAILNEGDVYATHTRASLEALTEVTVLVSDVDTFGRHASECPQMSMTAMNLLGEHLKQSLTIINRLAFMDVKMRLCDFLTEEANEKGEPTSEGVVVATGLSVKQMADFVGSTRQTVSTLLNEMQKDGVITRVSRGKYLIHDMHQLSQAA